MILKAGSVDCLYGDTGATKTSRLGDGAEYHGERTGGRPAHYISTDPGGWGPIQSLIDRGIIIPYKVSPNRPNLIWSLNALMQGQWPQDIGDPDSPLKPTPADEISCLLLDGLTSACEMVMQVYGRSVTVVNGTMQATDVKVPEMPRDSYIKSGDYVRRFYGRSDYMGVQAWAEERLMDLPNLPWPVILTCMECRGEDQQNKPIYGPQFAGSALTGRCGKLFGNLLHLDFLEEVPDPKDPKKMIPSNEPHPYLFLKQHVDPKDPLKIKYPAKVRAPRTLHERVPAFCPPRLDLLYKFLDSLREEEREASKEAPHAR